VSRHLISEVVRSPCDLGVWPEVGEGRERSLVPVSDGPLSGGPPSVLDGRTGRSSRRRAMPRRTTAYRVDRVRHRSTAV